MKLLPAIACLLIATAVALVFIADRNDGSPSSAPAPIRVNRERPSLSASSTAKFIKSLRYLGNAERQDRIRALSDIDLQRLTRAMIAEYLSAVDDTARRSSVPLLTLLAMECGRRDIDGFFAEINKRCEQESSIDFNFKLRLRSAAVAGLAEEDPQRAKAIQIHDRDACFPLPVTILAAREAVIRSLAKIDPEAAWLAVSADLEKGQFLPIQGLLAEIKDPALRATILDHISKLTANSQTNDDPFTHNIIFAILTHPDNRDALRFSTALGLAEHDPDAAWKWIKDQHFKARVLKDPPIKAPPLTDDEAAHIKDLTLIGRHFDSRSREFLREWAVRQPGQAMAFLDRHADDLSNPEQMHLAYGLLYRDPVSAINALPAFTDPAERLDWFSRWIKTFPTHSNENAWPVLPYLNETLPRSQILTTLSENLGRLRLPPDLQAQALQIVRAAQQELDHPQN